MNQLRLTVVLMERELSFLIGGEAGDGIQRSGYIYAKTLLRSGYYVFGYFDYPSLIRGGHNFYLGRASTVKVYSHTEHVNVLAALNQATIEKHIWRLNRRSVIIYDPSKSKPPGNFEGVRVEVPFEEITLKVGGRKIMRNMAAVAAMSAITGLNIETLTGVITGVFGVEKSKLNVLIARESYKYTAEKYGRIFTLENPPPGRKIILTGNEAIAIGAVKAGLKFYSAYPMTPASPILHYLAARQHDYDIVVIQPESEISAVNMVLGASFAGVRAMTATSGGGFSLMCETVGLAAMTETPIVIVVAQRPGPSTGIATYTGQEDLRTVLHASQSEFPRVVVAPGDVDECYRRIQEAFNISEVFQLPVIVLIDKYLGESHMSTEPFTYEVKIDRGKIATGNKEYKRYRLVEDGVSPRAFPSTRNIIVRGQSSEHTEEGFATPNADVRTKMVDKRFSKLPYIERYIEELEPVKLYGSEDAEVLLIAWGSTKGPLLEAMKILEEERVKVRFMQICYLEPFPTATVLKVMEKHRILVDVEGNRTGQLAGLIREKTGVKIEKRILRYDGRPFSPRMLADNIKEVLRDGN